MKIKNKEECLGPSWGLNLRALDKARQTHYPLHLDTTVNESDFF